MPGEYLMIHEHRSDLQLWGWWYGMWCVWMTLRTHQTPGTRLGLLSAWLWDTVTTWCWLPLWPPHDLSEWLLFWAGWGHWTLAGKNILFLQRWDNPNTQQLYLGITIVSLLFVFSSLSPNMNSESLWERSNVNSPSVWQTSVHAWMTSPRKLKSSANLEASLFASFYSFHNLYVPHETDPSVGSRGLCSNRLRWRSLWFSQGIWMDSQLPNGDVLLMYLDLLPSI